MCLLEVQDVWGIHTEISRRIQLTQNRKHSEHREKSQNQNKSYKIIINALDNQTTSPKIIKDQTK